jgi:hypothetical protein
MIVADVRNAAETAVRRHIDGDRTALRRAVEGLARDGGLRQLLKETAASEERLEEVRAGSYRHPNGFDKLVLLRGSDPDYKLRLHVWWAEGSPPAELNIHNHRWDFATVLVLGTYCFQIFEEAPAGRTFHEYRYHSPGTGDAFSMTPVGSSRLASVLEGRLEQGSSYLIDHATLHWIEGEERRTTATLVLQAPVSSPSTRVFSPEPMPEEHANDAVPLQRMSVDELRGFIRRVLDETDGVI